MTTETQTQTERKGRIESLTESILQSFTQDVPFGQNPRNLADWIAARIVDADADEDIEHAIEMR